VYASFFCWIYPPAGNVQPDESAWKESAFCKIKGRIVARPFDGVPGEKFGA
jgi:hypothetical protein